MQNKTIYCQTEEEMDTESKRIGESVECKRGKEGHEFLRGLGLIQFVRAFLMNDGSRIRVIGPTYSPNGMFSNLRSLEKEIRA